MSLGLIGAGLLLLGINTIYCSLVGKNETTRGCIISIAAGFLSIGLFMAGMIRIIELNRTAIGAWVQSINL